MRGSRKTLKNALHTAAQKQTQAVAAHDRKAQSHGVWAGMLAYFENIRSRVIPDPFETPRQMLERLCGRRLAYPKPRPAVGSRRYDQVQRRQASGRKRKGPNYAKQARRAARADARLPQELFCCGYSE